MDGSARAVRIIAAIFFVAMLYFARDVLIPSALAVMLAFLLHPLVLRLGRLHINRGIAVGITVILAAGVAGGVGYLVGRQFVDFSQEVPRYEGNLRLKARSFRSHGGTLARLNNTYQDLKQEMASTQPTTATTNVAATADSALPGTSPRPDALAPMKVEVVNDGPDTLDLLTRFAPPILVPITAGAIVFLLLIFLLLHSEDIRERLVWIAGMRQISLTTAALDEASQRISGYLRMLAVVNFTYGVMITACMWMIGLPTPFFWGALAGVLRFVPFIGPWIAAILPTLLAIAVFQGWGAPMEVIGAFAIVEFITNMLLEPWLYGKSAGISSLGIVVAAVFWAWLWGPVGLVLSVPLTVCLLVIGKQVPQLALLNHLFGENVEMPKPVRLYQRVLVGDDLTAGKMIDKELKEQSFSEVCDTLFMPVLEELKHDLQTGMIEMSQAREAMTILDVAATTEGVAPPESDQPSMLFVATQNEIDDLAATLLARAALTEGVAVETASSRSLAGEVVERAREMSATTICLVQVAPISWTHCRHLAKTLAARLPSATIYAVNIEQSDIEPPFAADTAQLPAKRLFRDVHSFMGRIREQHIAATETQPAPVA